MTSSINSSTGAVSATPVRSHHEAKRRDDWSTLTSDLKSGDLAGAQAAFAAVTKNVPAAVLSNPNSALGQLGAALSAGDVGAAKAAVAKVDVKVHAFRDGASGATPTPAPTPAPTPVATTSSTGGSAGTLLSEIA